MAARNEQEGSFLTSVCDSVGWCLSICFPTANAPAAAPEHRQRTRQTNSSRSINNSTPMTNTFTYQAPLPRQKRDGPYGGLPPIDTEPVRRPSLDIVDLLPSPPASRAPWEQEHQQPWQQYAQARPRSTSIARSPPLTSSTAQLSPAELAELLDRLDRALSHTRYAVAGLAAMAVWGYTSRAPDHVSILCPAHSKEAVMSWAVANGGQLDRDRPDTVCVDSPGSLSGGGGSLILRGVRVKYLDDAAWDSLDIVTAEVPLAREAEGQQQQQQHRPGDYFTASNSLSTAPSTSSNTEYARPRVLSLSSLLDQAAWAYADDARVRNSPRASRAVADDICWILRRIVEGRAEDEATGGNNNGKGEARVSSGLLLTPNAVPHVLSPLFWDPFTLAYPYAPKLFAAAGLTLPHPQPYGGSLGGEYDYGYDYGNVASDSYADAGLGASIPAGNEKEKEKETRKRDLIAEAGRGISSLWNTGSWKPLAAAAAAARETRDTTPPEKGDAGLRRLSSGASRTKDSSSSHHRRPRESSSKSRASRHHRVLVEERHAHAHAHARGHGHGHGHGHSRKGEASRSHRKENEREKEKKERTSSRSTTSSGGSAVSGGSGRGSNSHAGRAGPRPSALGACAHIVREDM